MSNTVVSISIKKLVSEVLDWQSQMDAEDYARLDQLAVNVRYIEKGLKKAKVESFYYKWKERVDCEEVGNEMTSYLYWNLKTETVEYSNDLLVEFDECSKPLLGVAKGIRINCLKHLEPFLRQFIADRADIYADPFEDKMRHDFDPHDDDCGCEDCIEASREPDEIDL